MKQLQYEWIKTVDERGFYTLVNVTRLIPLVLMVEDKGCGAMELTLTTGRKIRLNEELGLKFLDHNPFPRTSRERS